MRWPDPHRTLPGELTCPLCETAAQALHQDRVRGFYHCPGCTFIFADPASHLAAHAEKAIYDKHENDPADPRYRQFLNRLASPLLEKLHAGMHGLDYGCGPGPALSRMLEEAGMHMRNYDPFYAPDHALLARQYDFVTCTEVVEHFCRPLYDWTRLAGLLRPGGWLGVMTQFAPTHADFAAWHYKNDPTHVSFYTPHTFRWLAGHLALQVESMVDNVVLLRRPAGA